MTVVLPLFCLSVVGATPVSAQDSWQPQISGESAAERQPSTDPAPQPLPFSDVELESLKVPIDPEAPPGQAAQQGEPLSLETGAVQPMAGKFAIADAALIEGDVARTTFRLGLSEGVTAEVFTLANPYRVVIDLPDVGFKLDQSVGRSARGLIRAFRFGLFAEGKARIVLDATGPVRVAKAGMTAGSDGRRVELAVEIVPISGEAFGAGTGAKRSSAHAKPAPEPESRQLPKGSKPVILIDPGHGGIDPGAVGLTQILEKNVVLAVAHELKRELAASGRFDVRMTRSADIFISLDRRLKICRETGADLFISLHADSLEDASAAQSIRGATVYTLSERASDEQARRMAEKENASDLIAGIDVADAGGSDQVKSILIDLMKRETANFSAEFSKMLIARLGRAVPLAKDPQRSAAFKVLKQTHAPAVLVELGYLTNSNDEKLLNSPAWRRQVAVQVGGAVEAYFARQTARAK
jgi:N-acetylmuramoyl-L-alanine amidase